MTDSMERTLLVDKTATINPVDVSISAKGFLSILSTDRQNIKANTTVCYTMPMYKCSKNIFMKKNLKVYNDCFDLFWPHFEISCEKSQKVRHTRPSSYDI